MIATSRKSEMARVISIHEYELRRDADGAVFERAFRDADMRGLFDLTGLVEHHLLRGFKGARRGAYAAVWIFESGEAWERLWGSLEAPRRPATYPKTWRVWENEVLAPFLSQHPDTIRFTSYEEL
jgi:heme-degrading monooxygenase HmoA